MQSREPHHLLEDLGLRRDFVSILEGDRPQLRRGAANGDERSILGDRAFRRDYKPAQSMAGGGGGGGGAGQEVGQLSRQQREIVSATFNIVRDRAKLKADKFRENAVFLTLAQARLREQVEELSEKMNSRLDVVDPAFKTIAEALPKAAAEMKLAEADLKAQKAKEALSPEQRAFEAPAGCGTAVRDAGCPAARRRRRGRRRTEPDGRGSRRSVRARARQAGETSTRCSSAAEQQGGDRQVDELRRS